MVSHAGMSDTHGVRQHARLLHDKLLEIQRSRHAQCTTFMSQRGSRLLALSLSLSLYVVQPSHLSVSGLVGGCWVVQHGLAISLDWVGALLHSLISLLPLFHLSSFISRHLHSSHRRYRVRALLDPSPCVLCQPLVPFLPIPLSHYQFQEHIVWPHWLMC